MKFFGTYYHNLDAKGRLVVPARFRDALKDLKKLYILQGFEGSISVYPEEAYLKEIATLDQLNYKDTNARAYVRTMYASIEELEVDNAGRITLSVRVLRKYNLSTNVIVIGGGDIAERDGAPRADHQVPFAVEAYVAVAPETDGHDVGGIDRGATSTHGRATGVHAGQAINDLSGVGCGPAHVEDETVSEFREEAGSDDAGRRPGEHRLDGALPRDRLVDQ